MWPHAHVNLCFVSQVAENDSFDGVKRNLQSWEDKKGGREREKSWTKKEKPPKEGESRVCLTDWAYHTPTRISQQTRPLLEYYLQWSTRINGCSLRQNMNVIWWPKDLPQVCSAVAQISAFDNRHHINYIVTHVMERNRQILNTICDGCFRRPLPVTRAFVIHSVSGDGHDTPHGTDACSTFDRQLYMDVPPITIICTYIDADRHDAYFNCNLNLG